MIGRRMERRLERRLRHLPAQARAWKMELVQGGLVVLAAASVLHLGAGVPGFVVWNALLAYLPLALGVLLLSPEAFRDTGPGLANRVTFLRAGLVVPVAIMILHPAHLEPAAILGVLGLALLALGLDAVDGALARQTGRVTAFGARFDMELDAFLILVLAILVWQTGQTGAWVLLIGLMRYAFVVAGWPWSWLQRQLPPSRRRQTVCVVQSLALWVALLPLLSPTIAGSIALVALVLLIHSFAVDVLWLRRARGASP